MRKKRPLTFTGLHGVTREKRELFITGVTNWKSYTMSTNIVSLELASTNGGALPAQKVLDMSRTGNEPSRSFAGSADVENH
jgi:hypothetical protein